MENVRRFLELGADGEAIRRLMTEAIQLTLAVKHENMAVAQEAFEKNFDFLAGFMCKVAEMAKELKR